MTLEAESTRVHRGNFYRRLQGQLLAVSSVAAVIATWWVISLFVSPLILPSPVSAISGIVFTVEHGILVPALLLSIREMYLGLAIGVTAGLAIGSVLGTSNRADRLLLPYVNILNSIPGVILIPALVIWFGLGIKTRVIFVILITVWPMVINVRAGLSNSAIRYQDLGKAFEMKRRHVLFKLQFPASVPYMLAGLRISMGLAIIGMIVGEMDVSFKGLGFLLINFGASLQTAKLLGVVFVATLIGLAQAGVARGVEERFLPWIRKA